ncbi:MAG: outer membrane beta-barrel protein [Gammaproteobacteria bacterium]|nr:outer membrane beta-barrel protein [Gammaproteobacteria bacterium]MDH3372637.1 outer membrane beta-barrel protein [Gammaproteobacteria bacterium]MDH3410401.1 outer membrane beta-barrel protein [Gammaproteobacteria bacterium]MDH3552630.1 outer membrane beta-barrel protein [Gammaproteobacteria bacterium]
MSNSLTNSHATFKTMLLIVAFAPFAALADSGFYVGGSIGGATIEANLGDTGIPGVPSDIDEDDTAYKVFVGYNFDLPSIVLGVEAGYVDFGEPNIDVLGEDLLIDTTGINLWGIVALEAGPVDLFAKLGYISWDADFQLVTERASESGSDVGYGLGLAFNAGPIQIRGEYEVYDLDDADASMLSVGLVYQFD